MRIDVSRQVTGTHALLGVSACFSSSLISYAFTSFKNKKSISCLDCTQKTPQNFNVEETRMDIGSLYASKQETSQNSLKACHGEGRTKMR